MSKVTKKISLCFFGLFLFVSTFSSVLAQKQIKDALDQEVDLTFNNENMFQACAGLASLKKIPVGIELPTDFDFKKVVKIKIKPGTLREILDSMVEQDPDYKWEFREGVVNVYPIRSRDELIKSLLETKIEHFSSKKESGRQGIREIINGNVEINILLNSKFKRLGIATATNIYNEDATTDIQLSNTDLRGVLNRVVFDSGDSKVWSIQKSSDESILLFF